MGPRVRLFFSFPLERRQAMAPETVAKPLLMSPLFFFHRWCTDSQVTKGYDERVVYLAPFFLFFPSPFPKSVL